jgi:hypothetical protein
MEAVLAEEAARNQTLKATLTALKSSGGYAAPAAYAPAKADAEKIIQLQEEQRAWHPRANWHGPGGGLACSAR